VGHRQADLTPPLGYPGGPCHVVKRIHEEVQSPRLQDHLTDEVEKGKALSNPEAAKVYDIEVETGPKGPFKKLLIGPHAQYRMDLRGIQVPVVRGAIQDFLKNLNDWKSRQDWQYDHYNEMLARGEPVEWTYDRAKLFVVFTQHGRDAVKLVTTYWKGIKDPQGPGLGQCDVQGGYQPDIAEKSGWRTFVTNPDGTQPGETSTGQYPESALPSPPWKTEKPNGGNIVYNMPGGSGTSGDGKTIHKDKMRTPGTPGDQSPPADQPARTTPKRRSIEGGVFRPFPPGQDKQRDQKNPAKRYYQKYYKRFRNNIKRHVKKWQKKWKNRSQYKRDKERRQEYPQRFERKPSRGYKTLAERSKDWREEHGQPATKNQKKRKEDEKKKKTSDLLLSPPIGISHPDTGQWGRLLSVNRDDGTFHVELASPMMDDILIPAGLPPTDWEGDISIDQFLEEFEVNEGAERLLPYLDAIFEWEGDDDEDALEDEDVDGVEKQSFQVRMRPKTRQRRRKGLSRIKGKQYYRKNKQKARRRSKQWYRRLKKNPQFKKQQQIRRKNPQRFKRRLGSVLTAPDIAFLIGNDLDMGYVHNLSPMTGMVTYVRFTPGQNLLESLDVPDFMASVGFLSEEDVDAMFRLIDAELGLEGYAEMSLDGVEGSAALEGVDCSDEEFKGECERLVGKRELVDMTPSELSAVEGYLISMYVYDMSSEEQEPHEDETESEYDDEMIDPTDDDYIYGVVSLPEDAEAAQRLASFYMERKPPDAGKATWHDRATDPLMVDLAEDRPRAEKMNDITEVTDNPGSAKVIPDRTDLVNKNHWPLIHNTQASKIAVKIPEIMSSCGPEVHQRSRNIPIRLRRVDTRNAQWNFDVRGKSSNYKVSVRVVKHRGNVQDPYKVDVLVACSCPFWQWHLPEHWAKKKGYLLGKPRGTASKPDAKDPKGRHGACKHVLAVFERIKGFALPGSRGKQARYLADILDQGRVFFVPSEDSMVSRVAARYLERTRRV